MDIIKLFRPHLLALVALAQLLIHYMVSLPVIGLSGYDMPCYELALIVATSVLTAASGFIICDYYDMRIDQVNHPLRHIVGNTVSRHATMTAYIATMALALALSVVLGITTHTLSYTFIYVTIIGLLWFYASSYKRILVTGNLIAAASIALVPFIVTLYESRAMMDAYIVTLLDNALPVNEEYLTLGVRVADNNYKIVGLFSAYTLLWMLVREVVRNLYEEKGEREMECHTIPIVYGKEAANYVIYALLVVINAGSLAILIGNIAIVQLYSISYYVCTTLAFSAALAYIVSHANVAKDYKLALNIATTAIVAGLLYSVLFKYVWNIAQTAGE